ncbi:MAG: ATP-binding protein [Candidatus Natronoplasma sp.]
MKRDIITIDEEKCTGCGECIKGCPEGAIQIIDGRARLVNEAFCDGLGACIGDCPEGAIKIEKRDAEPYDEKAVIENMLEQGEKVLKAHLKHLKKHGQHELLNEGIEHLEELGIENPLDELQTIEPCECPSSVSTCWEEEKVKESESRIRSRLNQWPVQLNLIPVQAPYLDDSDLLITADCVPFAYPNFHQDFLDGKTMIVGCPKLDDIEHYLEKLTQIFKKNEINSITIVHMEVPCCFGLTDLVKRALRNSGKDISLENIIISVKGKRKE